MKVNNYLARLVKSQLIGRVISDVVNASHFGDGDLHVSLTLYNGETIRMTVTDIVLIEKGK